MSEIPAAEPSEIKNLNAEERETTVTMSDADEHVRIWSAQRRVISRLRKNPKATEVRSGHIGTSAWAEFTIPAADYNPATGIKRNVNMSDERRAALAERLAATRAGAVAEDQDDED